VAEGLGLIEGLGRDWVGEKAREIEGIRVVKKEKDKEGRKEGLKRVERRD